MAAGWQQTFARCTQASGHCTPAPQIVHAGGDRRAEISGDRTGICICCL